jgi:hypothetical protein
MDPRAILAGIAIFVLASAMLAIMYSSARQRRQTDIRKALIEKFGSAQDLGSFLQSPGGQRFVSDLFSGSNSPAHSVLGSIQKGVIILLVGITLIGVGAKSEMAIVAIGALLTSAGIGFLVSAAITRHLSRKWGLLDAPPRNDAAL